MSDGGGAEFESWAVVNTHPHRERVALENLERQGFVAYCPMIAKRIRHARKWSDVHRPLFPGYVFVALDASTPQWRPILSTVGIKNLICYGDRPSLMSNGFVESLRAREKNGVIAADAEALEEGQAVRLEGGSFDGLTATILEMDQKSRVTILLDLLNGQVRATMPLGGVRAL